MKRPKVLGQKPKAERRRQHDAARHRGQPWRRWYGLAIWRGVGGIRERQLAKEPLCERHKASGIAVQATVVNHVGGHGGDWERFIAGPFESLCAPCHDGDVQREERAAGRRAIEQRGGGSKV